MELDKSSIAVVVVGYNRVDGIGNLLSSLKRAEYDNDKVDLIISLDKSEIQDRIVDLARDFEWPYGNKQIRAFKDRLGLRKHILSCGDLTDIYDAVVVLEDDLIVSTMYYRYLKCVIPQYKDDPRIAGISLYSYAVNEFCGEPFIPSYNGYDAYLLQVAQSWGQCWTKEMWRGFRSWNYSDSEELSLDTYMPSCIFAWGKTSWKKNYMSYIVKNNLFFVYPYHSFTTNCSLLGEHKKYNGASTSDYQVALVEHINMLDCPSFENAVKYDVFFERIDLFLNKDNLFSGKQVCLDFYGLKRDYTGYDILISRNELPYRIIQKIGLLTKPIENNALYLSEGNDISVYDLNESDVAVKDKDRKYRLYDYNSLSQGSMFLLKYVLYKLRKRLFGQS